MSDQPQVVWHSMLDGVWHVRVLRKTEYSGVLKVSSADHVEQLEEEVHLAFGAAFGPDVSDVVLWQSRALAFVDGLFHAQPLKAGD